MSWRFRKTFKVLPGVKLNVTRYGLSATLGAAPVSVNIGPRGVYGNLSIPGTGLWSRERLDFSSATSGGPMAPSASAPFAASPSPAVEIRSASTELLGSESLTQLRKLLQQTYDERDALTQEISSATYEADIAVSRYRRWERGFLMRRIRKEAFTERKQAADTSTAKLEELQEQLHLTTLATEITVDHEQAEPYYRMRDEFAALSESAKIWDTLERRAVNRAAERSAAHQAITREPVTFTLNTCDLIQWEQKVPHLPNRTGGDLYIYPGFILYRSSKQAFALIDSRDVNLTFQAVRFIEEQKIPSDTIVVGSAWAKSNKDGSPDLRFRDNYEIPIVRYGALLFTSATGLQEEYQCSNPALAERFANAWNAFRASLTSTDSHSDVQRPSANAAPASLSRNVRKRDQVELDETMEGHRRRLDGSDPEAQFSLAQLYELGEAVAQDYAEAVRWYRKAADQGVAAAQLRLGNMYYYGQGVAQDFCEAARWYHKAANQEDILARSQLGIMYYKGEGVAQDFFEAARWFRKAADQDDELAQSVLGSMYSTGIGVVQDYSEATRWLLKAAEQGNAEAQSSLGDIYRDGQGVAQNYAEAACWYHRASDLGYAKAQLELGAMYNGGEGVAQDRATAARWFRKAADQGEVTAQVMLGLKYTDGDGVVKDYAEAVYWFRQAAEQGDVTAQALLADMYEKGEGVAQDRAEAAYWTRRALIEIDKRVIGARF